MARRAFTLIELLVVIAITAVLLGIIFIPVVQSFNFTRTAQAFTEAQQKARSIIERVTREVEASAGVRDNDGLRGSVGVVVPGMDGTPVTVLLEYAKLDVLRPAQGDPSLRDPNGAFFNPDTGRFDPTLKSPKGDVKFPVAPGATVVRYWLGLKSPLAADGLTPNIYTNPYADYRRAGNNRWMSAGGPDNLFVLYRAEVPLKVLQGNSLVVNTRYFEDANGDGEPDLDDPFFFTMNAPGQPVLAGPAQAAKAARMLAWKSAAQILTDDARYDAIQVGFDKSSRVLESEGNVPKLTSLVQFRPTSIANEPAVGTSSNRLGEEGDDSNRYAPDVFRLAHKSVSSAIVRVYPAGYDPNAAGANEYLVTRFDQRSGIAFGRTYVYDPDADTNAEDRDGDGQNLEVFDVLAFEDQVVRGWVYPLRRGIEASQGRSGWLGNNRARQLFTPVFPDFQRGRLTTSIGIDQWGVHDPSGAVAPRVDKNLPTRATGAQLTPTQDPNPPGNFYDAAYQNINRLYNKVFADQPSLRPNQGVHRFIDLRLTPNADGTPSPLHPTTGFPQATIVPGSEIVTGPDQLPGPNYGQPIRYTRVTANPGPNQYRINYADLNEPDYTLLGYPAPPAVYDPNNFSSAILQPRYRKGYIQLNSDENQPLPDNLISVFYRIQFTRPGDTVTVDYDTRDTMDVLLTVRNFSTQTTTPNPQNVTLKGSASIRNLVR